MLRCVGWNMCGSRCPSDDTCLTDQTTVGDPITITVSSTSLTTPNRAYNLNNKLDPLISFSSYWEHCLMGDEDTQCIYVRKFTKRQFGGNSDFVFIGDANFTNIFCRCYRLAFFVLFSGKMEQLPVFLS